ncbi:response regulator [Shewanella psychrophila]|nr:response regulator [Shewanella psychrophila]
MMRILIADDDPVGIEVNKRLIYSYVNFNSINNAYIKTVSNGYEAVDSFRESLIAREPFDLIMLDRGMPCFNGEYALNKIRQLEQRSNYRVKPCHIIIVTSRSPSGDILTISNHCDSYLLKPISVPAIYKILANQTE